MISQCKQEEKGKAGGIGSPLFNRHTDTGMCPRRFWNCNGFIVNTYTMIVSIEPCYVFFSETESSKIYEGKQLPFLFQQKFLFLLFFLLSISFLVLFTYLLFVVAF